MIQIGRYSFFDITYVNITAIKSFDDETYFFFNPMLTPKVGGYRLKPWGEFMMNFD